MRYFIVPAFLFITLSILIWINLESNPTNEESSYGECNKESETISQHHQDYLLQYGWHIQSKCTSRTKMIHYYPERIEMLQNAGLDLEAYNKEEQVATITTYTLEEKQPNGDQLSATLYEINEELVGGYGVLENWDPGIFSLEDKDRLIEQEKIRSER
ncbi:DUF4830 domain-containing protein [Pontibacillus salipaludis]|uniref:DUF4830 domain-containing protein n=1 Tax=Pontibacillus salipaludis TaxID=1697394 RepID=UPI0031ECCFD8